MQLLILIVLSLFGINTLELKAKTKIESGQEIASIRENYNNQINNQNSVEQCFNDKINRSYKFIDNGNLSDRYAILLYKNGIEVWNSYKCTKKVFMFGESYYQVKTANYFDSLKSPRNDGWICGETFTRRVYFFEEPDGLVFYEKLIWEDSGQKNSAKLTGIDIARVKVRWREHVKDTYSGNYKLRCPQNKNLTIDKFIVRKNLK